MFKRIKMILLVASLLTCSILFADELYPPANLTAQAGDGYVNLSWDAPSIPIDGFFEGFEEAFPPAGWIIMSPDGGTGWQQLAVGTTPLPGWTGGEAVAAPDGGNFMAFCTWTTGGASHNDQWLVTPEIVVGDDHVLSFYMRYWPDSFDDYVEVLISTGSQNNVNDFSIVVDEISFTTNASTDWELYSYDLNDFVDPGTPVYIAFRETVADNFNDGASISLDNVYVGSPTTRSLPEPVAHVASGEKISRDLAGQQTFTINTPSVTTRDAEFLGYNVYRDEVVINDELITETSYEDTDVVNGTTYVYYVTAVYEEGESDPSNTVEATPDEPVEVLPGPHNFTATVIDLNNVLLEWEAPEFGDWIYWGTGENTGNSIGTNAEAVFDVAHKYTVADLNDLGVVGRYVTLISFVPAEANCIYKVRVWTGGTNSPTQMVLEQTVTDPVINDWNVVELETPVYIDGTETLWLGYNVDTQTGFPAGCDDGPAVDGSGNMMNFGGWTTLLNLNDALNYNWNIKGFASFVARGAADYVVMDRDGLLNTVSSSTSFISGELDVFRTNDYSNTNNPLNNRQNRALIGYNVYRNGELIATNDPETMSYYDIELEDGTYTYFVTAHYEAGESEPTDEIEIVINTNYALLFSDDFEDHPDFALQFPPWTLIDLDGSQTYGFTDVDFPNSGSPMAFMIFNPTQTTPPLDLPAVSGDKMAASFAATTATNNDWMITPRIHLGDASYLTFYAKSYTHQFGAERFRVGVSTGTMNPAQFTIISETPYVEAPVDWTQYTFDLSDFDNQQVYIGIHCVSDDAFIFLVDDVEVWSIKDVSTEDQHGVAPMVTGLGRNYPNPFNPDTNIEFSVQETGLVTVEVFNILGQKIKTLVNEEFEAGRHQVVWNGRDDNNREVSSGIYFYRMKTGRYTSTKKMIMMK